MAVVADPAYVLGGLGQLDVEPGYAVPMSQFGEPVAQTATLVDPRTGYPSTSLPSSAGLGLISEQDAWLTGRPYGLPGTTAIEYANGRASMLGAVEVAPGYRVPLGIYINEIQRSVGYGDALAPSTLLDRPGAKPILAAIAGTILFGIVGALVAAGD